MPDATPAQITAYLDVTTGVPDGGVDVIFVPGTRFAEPAHITASLLEQGVAPIAVLTGGVNPRTGRREAQDHYQLLVDRGIDPERIIVEDTSTNTLENVTRSLPLLQRRLDRFDRVLVIAKWMHSRRVLMTLKANWPTGIRFYACTYAPDGVTQANWTNGPAAHTVIHNWDCIPQYLEAGHLVEVERDGRGAYV